MRSLRAVFLAGLCLAMTVVASVMAPPFAAVAVGNAAGESGHDAAEAKTDDGQAAKAATAAKDAVDYARDVKPILAKHCYACHGADKQESGLRLHAKNAALAGGDGGIAIKPGDAAASPLIDRIAGNGDDERMPPPDEGDALTEKEVGILRAWIEQGAKWPDSADGGATDAGSKHWAYQSPALSALSALPDVSDAAWPRTAIDRFILARLDAEKLRPSAELDRPRWLRRVSLDLIGLPPTIEEVDAFVADPSPDAFERAVDRLLASPRYGERWAAMWLDLARYADTQGYEKDNRRTIWRYRDWVIDAFNRNLPFDQFTIEQLAGDLLPDATAEQILATAFHRNTMTNTEGGTDNEEFRVSAVVDRINTTWAVWMATTFNCCQCHSHKYDPFTQREYYQFFAFLNQTEDRDNDDESPTMPMPTADQRRETERLQAVMTDIEAQLKADDPQLAAEADAWAARLQGATEWQTLTPSEMNSTDGATLTLQDDGSILASGERPANDLYAIAADGDWSGVTALRLEVLPDVSLPNRGSGRADDGNFVLSRFAVTAEPRDATPAQGRFVRLTLSGEKRVLSLAEVQVFSAGKNVAVAAAATQSSTDFEGEAGRAVDGNTNGNYDARSTTHTTHEDNPWWEVDLGEVRPVDRIVVWNRTDNDHGNRLAGCRVQLLDAERQPLWERALSDAPREREEVSPSGQFTATIASASADFSQAGFPVADAVAPKDIAKNGWAVQPQVASTHEAVFVLAEPLPPHVGRLHMALEHRYERPHFTLGHFRLTATRDTAIRDKHALPSAVRDALAVPREEQTDAHRAVILAHYRTIAPQLTALREQQAALKKQLAAIDPPQIPVMRALAQDKQRTTRMMNRGNFLDLGDEVAAAVPATLHSLSGKSPANRLDMARWLASDANPLFGRVLVNRLWERLFGIGIVETTEDFGTQGARPSHPQLLDWLALDAAHQTWDVKGILRRMVTSSVYRQSSQVTPELLERDAYNRLLARGPRVRLGAEVIRDQALAACGLLSTKMHGPSVMPPQPDGVWRVVYSGDQWITPSNEDKYRRGLYTFWRRTSPYPSMVAFDAPSREFCVLRRAKSNTPLQALVTLNDPVYVEAAAALAARVLREGGPTTRERIAYAVRLCVSRAATEAEIDRVAALLESEREHFAEDTETAKKLTAGYAGAVPTGVEPAELAAWTVVANVLLNLDEVVTKG